MFKLLYSELDFFFFFEFLQNLRNSSFVLKILPSKGSEILIKTILNWSKNDEIRSRNYYKTNGKRTQKWQKNNCACGALAVSILLFIKWCVMFRVLVEAPHESLHVFNGSFAVGDMDGFSPNQDISTVSSGVEEHPLTGDHILYIFAWLNNE